MPDKILAKELVDYSKTDKLLEWQRLIPWINNFAQKKARGVFSAPRAQRALGEHLTRDVYQRYVGGRKSYAPPIDAATKLLFGKMMLASLMPRINTTVKRMKVKGLVKGKLVKAHPLYPNIR